MPKYALRKTALLGRNVFIIGLFVLHVRSCRHSRVACWHGNFFEKRDGIPGERNVTAGDRRKIPEIPVLPRGSGKRPPFFWPAAKSVDFHLKFIISLSRFQDHTKTLWPRSIWPRTVCEASSACVVLLQSDRFLHLDQTIVHVCHFVVFDQTFNEV